MEDKAVNTAIAAEEAPSDEAKAAETKKDAKDAPAPPEAGDATAEASDKKEEEDATTSIAGC